MKHAGNFSPDEKYDKNWHKVDPRAYGLKIGPMLEVFSTYIVTSGKIEQDTLVGPDPEGMYTRLSDLMDGRIRKRIPANRFSELLLNTGYYTGRKFISKKELKRRGHEDVLGEFGL